MQKNDNNIKGYGLVGWFINNHVAANILMFLFLIGGVISVKSMKTETFPTIDPKLITISVSYPGATPYEVADGITRRVEKELVGIEGVKRISSSALEGYGITNVELKDFVDSDDVYNEIETAVNSLIGFPPNDAEKPIISKVKVTPNVVTLALHGFVEEETLRYWADLVEDELRALPGIGLTSVRGVRNYQISIEVSEDILRHHDLSLDDISNAINGFSKDIPAGMIESSKGDILLRVQEKNFVAKDFEDVVVKALDNGSVLRLKDVAKIIDGLEDKNLISKFNNEPAAFIDVKRSASEDTLAVAKKVKQYLKDAKLPQGLNISLEKDETINLKDRISLMLRNGLLGFMLVFLILVLFLDLKLAFWTSAAIPISFLGGLMILSAFGYSMNMITLFALIVVLGVVVDDGIITGESIFEAQNENKNDKSAVVKGVFAVIAPVSVGVATTMAAFAPLAFSTGTLGQIIRIIPPVVIMILFVSLLEAYFILPAHLSSPSRWSKGILLDIRNGFSGLLKKYVSVIFMPLTRLAIKYRYATLAFFLAIMMIVFGMVKSGVVRFVFFPDVEGNEITITAEMPVGTPFAETSKVLLEIEKQALLVRDEVDKGQKESIFESISVIIGEKVAISSGPGAGMGAGNGNNVGQVKVSLVPSDFRELSANKIESMIRKRVANIPNIEKLEFRSSLIGDASDIEIELSHQDEKTLNLAAKELKEEITKIAGTTEVAYSYEEGKSEYVFKLNAQGLAVGLSTTELGRQIRSAFFGAEVQRFQRNSSEVIVYVRYTKQERESLEALKDMRIRLADNRQVPLAEIADIIEQNGYSKIETVNGKRIVSITSDVDKVKTTPNDVIDYIKANIIPDITAKYSGLSYSFEGESREQGEDLASLGRNMLIALMLIYMLLGAQLRSYIQPIVIMSSIPFGVVGAILGHYILGYDLTFISFFGIVALMGVVVNDSVVLIDYCNKKVLEGVDLRQSILLAVERRFRPILLTTLSTSLGLLPVLLEKSLQAQFLVPMVVSLAMGIIFATFVILILIPCLVLIVEDIKKMFLIVTNKVF